MWSADGDEAEGLDIDGLKSVLQAQQELAQKRTFTHWVNAQLAKHRTPSMVQDLFQDLRDGHLLLDLLEGLSGEQLVHEGSRDHPIHRWANVATALAFLQGRGVKLVNINVSDVVEGTPTVIMGLVWTIIQHFQLEQLTRRLRLKPTPQEHTSTPRAPPTHLGHLHSMGSTSAKQALLQWAQDKAREMPINIQDFGGSWRNGLAFAAVINALQPGLLDTTLFQHRPDSQNLEMVFSIADTKLGIPRILETQDLTIENPDEKSVITYVSLFLKYSRELSADEHDPQEAVAASPGLGHGLSEQLANEQQEFMEAKRKIEGCIQGAETFLWARGSPEQLRARHQDLMQSFNTETLSWFLEATARVQSVASPRKRQAVTMLQDELCQKWAEVQCTVSAHLQLLDGQVEQRNSVAVGVTSQELPSVSAHQQTVCGGNGGVIHTDGVLVSRRHGERELLTVGLDPQTPGSESSTRSLENPGNKELSEDGLFTSRGPDCLRVSERPQDVLQLVRTGTEQNHNPGIKVSASAMSNHGGDGHPDGQDCSRPLDGQEGSGPLDGQEVKGAPTSRTIPPALETSGVPRMAMGDPGWWSGQAPGDVLDAGPGGDPVGEIGPDPLPGGQEWGSVVGLGDQVAEDSAGEWGSGVRFGDQAAEGSAGEECGSAVRLGEQAPEGSRAAWGLGVGEGSFSGMDPIHVAGNCPIAIRAQIHGQCGSEGSQPLAGGRERELVGHPLTSGPQAQGLSPCREARPAGRLQWGLGQPSVDPPSLADDPSTRGRGYQLEAGQSRDGDGDVINDTVSLFPRDRGVGTLPHSTPSPPSDRPSTMELTAPPHSTNSSMAQRWSTPNWSQPPMDSSHVTNTPAREESGKSMVRPPQVVGSGCYPGDRDLQPPTDGEQEQNECSDDEVTPTTEDLPQGVGSGCYPGCGDQQPPTDDEQEQNELECSDDEVTPTTEDLPQVRGFQDPWSGQSRELEDRIQEASMRLRGTEQMLQERHGTVAQAVAQQERIWAEIDESHSALSAVEGEVQDLAQEDPKLAHELMEAVMGSLQYHQRVSREAERRAALVNEISGCWEEFCRLMESTTLWIRSTESLLANTIDHSSTRALNRQLHDLQMVTETSRQNQQRFREVSARLAKLGELFDTDNLMRNLSQALKHATCLQQDVDRRTAEVEDVTKVMVAIEAEVKRMESDLSKITTLLSSVDLDNVPVEEHLVNRQVVLDRLQEMGEVAAVVAEQEPSLALPGQAIGTMVAFARLARVRELVSRLQALTREQRSMLQTLLETFQECDAVIGGQQKGEKLEELIEQRRSLVIKAQERLSEMTRALTEGQGPLQPLDDPPRQPKEQEMVLVEPTQPPEETSRRPKPTLHQDRKRSPGAELILTHPSTRDHDDTLPLPFGTGAPVGPHEGPPPQQQVEARSMAVVQQLLEDSLQQGPESQEPASIQEVSPAQEQWELFDVKSRELEEWLKLMEDRVSLSPQTGIEEMIERLQKDCMGEIQQRETEREMVQQLGDGLKAINEPSRVKEVNSKLQHINGRWQHLGNLIESRVLRLQARAASICALDSEMNSLCSWLSHIEHELSKPLVYTHGDHEEIERKLAEQQELQRDIDQHSAGVASVLNLCNDLVQDPDTKEKCDSIQQSSCSLDCRWRNICAMSVERRMKIEETCRLWCRFLDDYSQWDAWLQGAEQLVAKSHTSDVLYTHAREELKVYEALQWQAQERLTQLQLINKQYCRLVQDSDADPCSRTRHMVHLGNQRLQQLQDRITAIVHQLKHFIGQREEFENSREGLQMWLTEMDLQLTNVEHFSESDVVDKVRQLNAFQQEIALHREKIEQLSILGKQLIERMEPADTVEVEQELRELHTFYQEVFGRVERFHLRLLSTGPLVNQGLGAQEECDGVRLSWEPAEAAEERGAKALGPLTLVEGIRTHRSGSMDSIPLEWDHTVDVGDTSSQPGHDRQFFTSLSGTPPQEPRDQHPISALELNGSREPSSRHQLETGAASPLLHRQGYAKLLSECSGSTEVRRTPGELSEELPQGPALVVAEVPEEVTAGMLRWDLLQAQALIQELGDKQKLQQRQQLNADLVHVSDWLGRVQPTVQRAQSAEPPTSLTAIQDRMRMLGDLQKELDKNKAVLEAANLSSRDCWQEDSADAQALETKLHQVNCNWSRTSQGLQDSWAALHTALMHSQDFHHTTGALHMWLANCARRHGMGTVSLTDPDIGVQALIQHRNELKGLEVEMLMRQSQVNDLERVCRQLAARGWAPQANSLMEEIGAIGTKLRTLLQDVAGDLRIIVERLEGGSVECPKDLDRSVDPSALTQLPMGAGRGRVIRAATVAVVRDDEVPRGRAKSGVYTLLRRVLRVAIPLHLVFTLLLLLASLMPPSHMHHCCALANNFAHSLHPMLRYTHGPPPT
ncbi:uncharacterized protein [Narcine bancroftii]|uniref:uncharacterized protein isoform X3 n=1 Tax=Narcine bancroftii TaxID=1343680 RepID=UPI0038318F19